MTRLKNEWLMNMEKEVKESQEHLVRLTGRNYRSLIDSTGWPASPQRVAIVPVTQGQGIIENFSFSVGAILREMGLDPFITKNTDVAGILEAREKNGEILFMADDHKFIAWNIRTCTMVDNDYATALGYVSALEGAAGPLEGKPVLVMGFGPLGREFRQILTHRGAEVSFFEQDKKKQQEIFELGHDVLPSKEDIKRFRYLVDATNTGDWLGAELIHPEAWIAAPGVPLSLDHQAAEKFRDRLIHDLLQIGVASMLRLVL